MPRLRPHLLIAALGVLAAAPLGLFVHERWTVWRHTRDLAAADPALRQAAADYFLTEAPASPGLRKALAGRVAHMPLPEARTLLGGVARKMAPRTDAALLASVASLPFPDGAAAERLRLDHWMLEPLRHPAELTDADQRLLDPFLRQELTALPPVESARLAGTVVRHAPPGPLPELARSLVLARLAALDDLGFQGYLGVLDGEGLWSVQRAPLDLFGRQVRSLDAATPEARRRAAYLLSLRPDAAAVPELQALLPKWVADSDPKLRRQALQLAESWAGEAAPARAAVLAATADRDTALARHAWLAAGMMGLVPADPARLRDIADPQVAEAAGWAMLRSHPRDPAVLDAILDWLKQPALRAAAALALGESGEPAAQAALASVLAPGPAADVAEALVQWRAILLLRAAPAGLARFAAEGAAPALRTAALFRLGAAPAGPAPADDAGRLLRLAQLEGLAPASVHLDLPERDLTLNFLAAARAEADPARAADFVRAAVRGPDAAVRMAAVDLALTRFTDAERTELARTLVSGDTEAEYQAGAILCGAGKLRPRRIVGGSARFLEEHEEWTEEKLYAQDDETLDRLGLSTIDALADNLVRWRDARTTDEHATRLATLAGLILRGDAKRPAGNLNDLMWDQRLPRPSAVYAQLCGDPAAGFDLLLASPAEPGVDAPLWLADGRWSALVARRLPQAPVVPVWADPGLRHLRIEALGAWWRLHGRQQTQGAADAR